MKTAVLSFHGFMGSPNDQKVVMDYLQKNNNYDVYSFVLPGHSKGEGKERFNHELWIKACQSEVEKLIDLNYDKIYLLGHSMGGVLASIMASKYKEIDKLVLISPAFHFMGFSEKHSGFIKRLKITPRLIAFFTKDATIKRLVKLSRFYQNEYLHLICQSQDCLDKIDIPVLQLVGKKDKLVKWKDSKYVFKRLATTNKKILKYKEAKHNVFETVHCEEACKDIAEFLKA